MSARRVGPPAGHHRPLLTARHQLHRIAHLAHLHLPASLLRQVDRAGPLESPWVAAGLGGLLAASVLLAVRHHRRAGPPGRRRWLRRTGLAAWLSGLTVLTGLAGVNVYVGYVPTLPGLLGAVLSPGGDGGSRVAKLVVGAPDLDVPPSPAYVYLPPGYDQPGNAARRYPVVYLLHGYPGGPSDWFRGAQVQQVMDAMLRDRLVQPMIVVAPDASGGWLHDSEMLNQVGGPQVATYLTRTVVDAVDGSFRTVPDRGARAIGGMSSGGYGALNLGLRHQGVYSVILSEMPYGDPGPVTWSLLGGSHALWLANSPSHYIPTITFQHPMAVDLLAGSRDRTRGGAVRLARMLAARGQQAQDTIVPDANHTWRGARAELPYALAFASQHLTVRGRA
jgi:S-formylglutathione hydrolase FrmB